MKAKSDKKVVKNTSAKSKQKSQKMTMQEMIEKVDASKKVNPLDLSSDQDLSIASFSVAQKPRKRDFMTLSMSFAICAKN